MKNYFHTVYLFGTTMLKRGLRDPLTSIILIGIPVVLLVIFGLFLGGNQDINLRTAIVAEADNQFAQDFEKTLQDTEVLAIEEEKLSRDAALEQMKKSELDTVIELPTGFGEPNQAGVPSGDIKVYVDQSNAQTTEIARNILSAITDEYNKQLIGVDMPLNITTESINVAEVKAIHWVFPIFTGLGLLMVGMLGIASTLPTDKKSLILRRLHVTPIRKSQVVLGTGLAFLLLGVAVAVLMTLIAFLLFNLTIAGSPIFFAFFMLAGLISLVGLGLAVGGIAKNPTQGESIGQIVFIASLGLSGIWIPVAMMPEFLQGFVAFMPLTPIIDGIRMILIDGAGFVELLPQLGVILGWTIIAYAVSFKTFRWE